MVGYNTPTCMYTRSVSINIKHSIKMPIVKRACISAKILFHRLCDKLYMAYSHPNACFIFFCFSLFFFFHFLFSIHLSLLRCFYCYIEALSLLLVVIIITGISVSQGCYRYSLYRICEGEFVNENA